jgi:VIT1/CCC1 family predicted Fe2+/Mn2+ transporter
MQKPHYLCDTDSTGERRMTTSNSGLPNTATDTPIPSQRVRRLLDPIDRASEILFGLIMVLAITCSFSVAEAGREDIRAMLVGALGCNIAWGIVDAMMYLMVGFTERARGLRTLREVRRATDPIEARRIIAGALPVFAASVLKAAELDSMRSRLAELPEPPTRTWLDKDDLLGALAVFLWVFLTTLPVVIPFVLMREATGALRVSNVIAIALLYVTGHSLGRYAGGRPWLTGLSMVLLGIALVAATIALGG